MNNASPKLLHFLWKFVEISQLFYYHSFKKKVTFHFLNTCVYSYHLFHNSDVKSNKKYNTKRKKTEKKRKIAYYSKFPRRFKNTILIFKLLPLLYLAKCLDKLTRELFDKTHTRRLFGYKSNLVKLYLSFFLFWAFFYPFLILNSRELLSFPINKFVMVAMKIWDTVQNLVETLKNNSKWYISITKFYFFISKWLSYLK